MQSSRISFSMPVYPGAATTSGYSSDAFNRMTHERWVHDGCEAFAAVAEGEWGRAPG
jgi:hypothetical protein